MRILVTGAAGFIGYHVCRTLLERGDEVVGVDNYDAGLYGMELKRERVGMLRQQGKFEFVLTDLEHMLFVPFALRAAFDAIIHLAAHAGIRSSIAPRLVTGSNVVGFVNVMELAAKRRTPVVYASSSSIYGQSAGRNRLDHRTYNQPLSLYAATKRANELIAYTYALNHDLPTIGLRYFTVYGPWGRPDMAMWKFADALLRGDELNVVSHGQVWRDFTYIDDVVAATLSAMFLLLDAEKPNGVDRPGVTYDVGTEEQVSLMELVRLLAVALDRTPVAINHAPAPVCDAPATLANLEGAVDDLNYAPRVSLPEGVGRFCAWFKDYMEAKK